MSEEPRKRRESPEHAASGASVEDGRDLGRKLSGAHEREDRPIRADAERLRIGEVDLRGVREVLAEAGARGSATLDALSAAETVTLLDGIVGLEGALESLRARAVVHLEDEVKADCLRREESPRRAALVARSEAARVLRRSRSVAGRTLATSRRLVRSMPGMMTALAETKAVPQAAHKVGSVVGPASPELRRQVGEILVSRLPELEGCGPQEWGDAAAKILHALDPDGAASRHQAAKRERHVTVRRADHGMARITALVPGIDGARIRKGLSVSAESARAQGDRRGHQQIMADLDTGDLVAVESRARAFPAALTRFLTLAHQTCRAPHCDAPIRQVDHITPWSQGGATSLDNGNGLCAACNQKELAGERVRVVRDEGGRRRTVRWTTRYGRSATRGAINLDPLGTYRRRRAKEERAPGPTPDGTTLQQALTCLQLRLTDIPSPQQWRRPGEHPGNWSVLRGIRGR